MNHARIKAADLRYQLFERSVHPELFDVLRCAAIEDAAFSASLVISGQSHVLTVRAGPETVTEVVAPSDASLPRIGVRTAFQLGRSGHDRQRGGESPGASGAFAPLAAGGEEVRRDEGLVRYSALLRVERYAPAEYAQVVGRLLRADRFERIKAFFDDEATPAHATARSAPPELTPFALMDYRRGRARLEVTSVHACPHELTVVRVDSRISAA